MYIIMQENHEHLVLVAESDLNKQYIQASLLLYYTIVLKLDVYHASSWI